MRNNGCPNSTGLAFPSDLGHDTFGLGFDPFITFIASMMQTWCRD